MTTYEPELLELCLTVGTNPDLIRREQPLYHRVAEAAGAG